MPLPEQSAADWSRGPKTQAALQAFAQAGGVTLELKDEDVRVKADSVRDQESPEEVLQELCRRKHARFSARRRLIMQPAQRRPSIVERKAALRDRPHQTVRRELVVAPDPREESTIIAYGFRFDKKNTGKRQLPENHAIRTALGPRAPER